jgi:hypothetical protein
VEDRFAEYERRFDLIVKQNEEIIRETQVALQEAREANQAALEASRRAQEAHEAAKRNEESLVVTYRMLDQAGSTLADHKEFLNALTRGWVRHEESLKRHEEFWARHEELWKMHEEAKAEHEAWLIRIDRKIEMIADLILRGKTGNGQGDQPS